MNSLSKEELAQFAEDIAFVRKAIEKNTSIIRRINFKKSLRLVTLLGSLSIFLFCGLFWIITKKYGNIINIPNWLQIGFVLLIFIDVLILGVLKSKNILSSAKKLIPDISIMMLLKEYYTAKIYYHFIPVGLAGAIIIVLFAINGNLTLILPAISIAIGITYNNIGVLLSMNEFFIVGYWLVITGCLLLFINIPIVFGICLTFGLGFLILSVLWFLPDKKIVKE